jgi:hypothetical protein
MAIAATIVRLVMFLSLAWIGWRFPLDQGEAD